MISFIRKHLLLREVHQLLNIVELVAYQLSSIISIILIPLLIPEWYFLLYGHHLTNVIPIGRVVIDNVGSCTHTVIRKWVTVIVNGHIRQHLDLRVSWGHNL